MIATSHEGETISPATIVELSSHSIRAGCAGDLYPQAELPSVMGITSAQNEFSFKEDLYHFPLNPLEPAYDISISQPLQFDVDGKNLKILDEEELTYMLRFLLNGKGAEIWNTCNPIEHPILLTEKAKTDEAYRNKLGEIIFETLNGNSMTFYKEPALALFSCGQVSGTVWDSGYDVTTSSIVSEGYTAQQNVAIHTFGRNVMIEAIYLTFKGERIEPKFATKNDEQAITSLQFIDRSYRRWGTNFVIDDLIRTKGVFHSSSDSAISSTSSIILPDSVEIDLDAISAQFIDPLVDGGCVRYGDNVYNVPSCLDLLNASWESFQSCTKAKDFSGTILPIGENTCIHGFDRKFIKHLGSSNADRMTHSKNIIPKDILIRKYASFVGASIFTCLGSFQSYLISSLDYQENGSRIFSRRCP